MTCRKCCFAETHLQSEHGELGDKDKEDGDDNTITENRHIELMMCQALFYTLLILTHLIFQQVI